MRDRVRAQWQAIVRDAVWLTASRATAYARILLALTGMVCLIVVALSHGGLDPRGEPLGTDFVSFWAASTLTLAGTPALVYDPAVHAGVQAAIVGHGEGSYAFFYPPPFLLVCWPLALLAWPAALLVWLGATGLAYSRVAAALIGGARPSLLPILAFPAVFVTIGHGQNAFLTTALFGGALLATPRRPVLAGLLFGALAIKPQLGLLVPVFLIASGAWTSLAVAALTVVGLALAATVAFGAGIWPAFLVAAPLARMTLEQDLIGAGKLVSVFAAVHVLHGSTALAYAAQGVVAVLAAVLLARLCRLRPVSAARGPALVTACLLASPFLLDYDLTLLALPLAWLHGEAGRTRFLPYEKLAMAAAFLLPLVSRVAATTLDVPLAPFVVMALLLAVVRRGLEPPEPASGPDRRLQASTVECHRADEHQPSDRMLPGIGDAGQDGARSTGRP